jgi:hypothetical protein
MKNQVAAHTDDPTPAEIREALFTKAFMNGRAPPDSVRACPL